MFRQSPYYQYLNSFPLIFYLHQVPSLFYNIFYIISFLCGDYFLSPPKRTSKTLKILNINRTCGMNGEWGWMGIKLGMAYRITDISEKPIYRLFCKYRISVSVKIISVKISDIGYRISAVPKYRISVREVEPIYGISDIGWSKNIRYRWIISSSYPFIPIPPHSSVFIHICQKTLPNISITGTYGYEWG